MTSRRSKFLRSGTLRGEWLAVLLALYFSLMFNDPLWESILKTQSLVHAPQRWAVFWSAACAITAFQAALISCLLWGRLTKPVAVLLILITASANFFGDRYGVLYDTTMLHNILATNPAEAGELITAGMLWDVAWRSALPLAAVAFFPLAKAPLHKELGAKLLTIGICLALVTTCIAVSFKSFSSATRNQKSFRHQVLPASPLVSLARLASQAERVDPKNKDRLDSEAIRTAVTDTRPAITIVVVVGESVRAASWGLSGYERQTTPRLASLPAGDAFNFPYATACGTNTAVSVPCMFSIFGRGNYDERKIRRTESIPEFLSRLGVRSTWIDNQSGCKGVCDNIPSFMTSDLLAHDKDGPIPDGKLVDAMSKVLQKDGGDELILLHTLGNHGPAYYRRYPGSFERFRPTCTNNDLAACSQESIINAYDNATLYTDHLLGEIIDRLKQLRERRVALIYVSDHGESLGEKGVYLHGIPYLIAPEEQLRVPFFVWMPESTRTSLGIDGACLARNAMKPTHHDVLAHSLLGLFNVSSKAYRSKMDIFGACRVGR